MHPPAEATGLSGPLLLMGCTGYLTNTTAYTIADRELRRRQTALHRGGIGGAATQWPQAAR